MKNHGLQIAAIVLLLLCSSTVHPGGSGVAHARKPAASKQGIARLDMSPGRSVSYLLAPARLVAVVGDSSDGGGGYVKPQYCYDAYQRCLTSCNSWGIGWDLFGGQFGSIISLSLSFGCATGCQIGFASCG